MGRRGRSLAAVIAGFLAMSGFVFIAFTAAFFLMGDDAVFPHRGTYESSAWQTGISASLGFLAALVGGAVCGGIALSPTSIRILAVVVAVIGVAYAGLSLTMEVSVPRSSGTSFAESQFFLRSPPWLLFANPVIDLIGILLGGTLAMRGRNAPTASRAGTPTPEA